MVALFTYVDLMDSKIKLKELSKNLIFSFFSSFCLKPKIT